MGLTCLTECKSADCGSWTTVDGLRKEIWRLRINWSYIALLSVLLTFNITSLTSSYHQFVINPSREDSESTNGTLNQFQYGLGLSESFYSWSLAINSIGSFVGGMLTGLLVRCIPYWYLFMSSLLTHIVGFILYAVANEGWILMISKFLAGYFVGAGFTLALSYYSESSVEYVDLMRKRKKEINDDTAERLKGYLFTIVTIGETLGSLAGPGVAIIFAQFDIDQFRSIAWFNLAIGIVLLMLQFIVFHGEISCKKNARSRDVFQCGLKEPSVVKPSPLQIFILIILILLRLVGSFRMGMYSALFNPILSDTFGFTERNISYYLFGFSLADVIGVLVLVILQKLKASNQIIAFIGVSMTVVGCILVSDWQAIPYDPCTEYSPFHHPEVTQNYSIEQPLNETSVYFITTTERQPDLIQTTDLAQLRFYSTIDMKSTQNDVKMSMKLPVDVHVTFSCHYVDECECKQYHTQPQAWSVLNSMCLFYDDGRLTFTDSRSVVFPGSEYASERFKCVMNSTMSQTPFSVCVHLYGTQLHSPTRNTSSEKVFQASKTTATIQSLLVLSNDSYYIAKSNCVNANITNRQCHWTPSSIITNKECEDCQPICRSREQSLTFVQFVLGTTLLTATTSVMWVPITVMALYQVSMEFQGIITGTLTAICSIGVSISPLFLVSSYEAVQKRTFLPMVVLVGLHLPFLIIIIVLYRKLGAETHSSYSRVQTDENEQHDE